MLLLALLTGCGSGNTPQESSPTVAPTTGAYVPTDMVNLECVTKIVSTYEGAEQTATIRYEEDGIHIVPDTTGSRYETVLDPNGKEIYELRYNDENILTYRTDYTYDEAGNLLEWLNYDTVDDQVASRTTHIYDEAGREIKTTTNYRNDIPGGYYDFTYDANGHIASRSYTDMEGVNTWNYTYTCDASGRIVTGTISYPLYNNSNHEQLGYYTLSYDEGSRIIAQHWTETHGSIFVHSDYFYTYNETGFLTSYRKVDDDGEVDDSVIYSYDSNNRLISIEDLVEGSKVSFIYEHIEVSPLLSNAAAFFSQTGLIQYYAPMPEFQH